MRRIIYISLFILLPFIGTSQKITTILKANDVSKLTQFIKEGGNIDLLIEITTLQKDVIFVNPFTYAQIEKSYDVLDFLIENRLLFKDADHYVAEVFIHSLSRDEGELSNKLYEIGINLNDSCSVCHQNNAILAAAASENEYWYFKLKNESDLFFVNENGVGLLHVAPQIRNERIIADILSIKELDINRKDVRGYTALDYAAWSENDEFDIFKKLISAGADFRNTGFLPLRYGYNPHPEIQYFATGLVKENGENIFEYDQDGLNILDYITEIPDENFGDGQHKIIEEVLQQMIYQLEALDNIGYSNTFISGKSISRDIIYISDLMDEDTIGTTSLFKTYLEFIGVTIQKGYLSPLNKKDIKYAYQLFGKANVDNWLEMYAITL